MTVSETQIADFRADGAVRVRGLLSPAEVAVARAGVEANLARPGPRAIVASGAGDPGRFFEDFRNWTRIDGYRRIVETSAAAGVAGVLMGAREVRLHHDHLLVKEAGTRQSTPWHQDQPYYNIDGAQTCSLWIPLDPVPVSASLRFVAGSHLGPWLMPRTFMTGEARWFPAGALAELPDIDAEPGAHRILSWALEPGDAIAFSMLALHSASGSTTRRRALSLRFTGDDVVHAPRPWKTSPDFPELDGVLPAGAPLDHPLFPVVWSGPDWRDLERFAFGDGPALADELIGLVLGGRKTATCWSLRDGQQTYPGKRMAVCDGEGRPRAVVETVTLEQKRYFEVDAAFARLEGEGDLTLEDWREGHRLYFERTGGFEPEMMLWCETFRLVAEIRTPFT